MQEPYGNYNNFDMEFRCYSSVYGFRIWVTNDIEAGANNKNFHFLRLTERKILPITIIIHRIAKNE